MKLINQSNEFWGECPTSKEDSLNWIEKAGRICYKSQPKGEAAKFVQKLADAGHTAMLEHSNIVYRSEKEKLKNPKQLEKELHSLLNSKYLRTCIVKDRVYIGGNWRAWCEANFLTCQYSELPEIIFPTYVPRMELVTNNNEIPIPLKRVTVLFKTSRAVSHELVRHRPCSFAQESQRYCAYRNELEFIIPTHYIFNNVEEGLENKNFIQWQSLLQTIEMHYKYLLESGEKPQEARHILPNCTTTQIVVTTDVPHWNWLFRLRCDKAADPNMQYAMLPIKTEFEKRGWLL